jgi:hypothetical protein
MALQVSTAFKSAILGPMAFETIFSGGAIRVFAGPQPQTADDAEQGHLLGVVTLNGAAWGAVGSNGLRFARSGPVVVQQSGDAWVLMPTAAGTAGWWRLVASSADDGSQSYSSPRIDGAVGTAGSNAEMILPATPLVIGTGVPLQAFSYTIPPIVGI